MKQILTAIISSITTIILMIVVFFIMSKGEAEIIVGTPNEINVGVIETFSGSSVPDGYLLCDGRAVSRTTYSNLFSVVGTTYGAGDGSTTFNLPNYSGKSVVGKDSSNFTVLGGTGGNINTALKIENLPSHTHTVTAKGSVSSTFTGSSATTSENGNHQHNISVAMENTNGSVDASQKIIYRPSGTTYYVGTLYTTYSGTHSHTVTAKGSVSSTFTGSSATTSSVGTGTSFSNMGPYIVANYIIKY